MEDLKIISRSLPWTLTTIPNIFANFINWNLQPITDNYPLYYK